MFSDNPEIYQFSGKFTSYGIVFDLTPKRILLTSQDVIYNIYMKGFLNKVIFAILLSFIPTLLIWVPFFFRFDRVWGIPLPKDGMATVVSNYDGPLYLVAAKTLYDKESIKNFAFNLPTEYYAAHFPLFPFLIKFFAGIFGFPYSMLFVTIATSVLALYFFHEFISLYVKSNDAKWLTFVFSILPARWLIVRSIGSPEPLFIAAIIASVFYFKKEKYLAAGVWGAISVLTKSPGILLFVSYLAIIFFPEIKKSLSGLFTKSRISSLAKYLPILLIPAALLSVFAFYGVKTGDFWAYFHSGDNIHLFPTPFQIFNYSQSWVGTFWLEEIIFVYLLCGIGLSKIIEKKDTVAAWFTGIFFVLILFVSHRDLVRYVLPIVPFLMAGYSDFMVKKEFKFVMAILVIPIYLFSLAYISQNTMPIADWSSLL